MAKYEDYERNVIAVLNSGAMMTIKDIDRLYGLSYYCLEECPDRYSDVLGWTNKAKTAVIGMVSDGIGGENASTLYYNLLLLESRYLFDSYMIYLEKNREEQNRFYLPKRKCLTKIGLVQMLQDLEDDKLETASISLPPGTGKTTISKFFTSWIIGRHVDDYNLFYSHSGDITRMYYDGVLDICTSDEYTFQEVFPRCKMHSTNAKRETINFGTFKPFPNLQTTSVGSSNAGKVRANRYLICDDLIGGIEEAMSADRLDKLWNIYTVDARQRKVPGCKEVHIATRWSVNDVIGRLERANEGNDRARFIAVPDIDPVTGKSNFAYTFNGFDEEFFHDQERLMDDVSYRCLYKNQPIEREGLLYHRDDFERYYDLPAEEPDAILAVCDTKDRGTDFCSMPIFYQYGDRYFLADVVYDNNSDIDIIDSELEQMIIKHKPHQVQFESNSAGGRTADDIKKRLVGKSRTTITKKYTTQNKETKIIVNSAWVKSHVVLKDDSVIKPKSQYSNFVNAVMTYSVAGRNAHDDAPDSLAMFAEFSQKLLKPTMVVSNPLR